MHKHSKAVVRKDLREMGIKVPVGRGIRTLTGAGHYGGKKPLPCRQALRKQISRLDRKEYDPSNYEGDRWFQVKWNGRWQCAVEIDWETS